MTPILTFQTPPADNLNVTGAQSPSFASQSQMDCMGTHTNHQLSAAARADRRHYPRYTVGVQIELREEGSDVPIRAETSDVSLGGCYVQLNMTLSLGTYLNGRLWIEDQPVTFRGRVVTTHPQFGNGIMFLEFHGDGEQILTSFLARVVQ